MTDQRTPIALAQGRWRRRWWREAVAPRQWTKGSTRSPLRRGHLRTSTRSCSVTSQELAIAIGVGVLAVLTYLWQLSVPMFLQLYDSGVYLASSIHLVSGVMPYRDFSFVQPPGILWILSPVALVSRLYGTHDGFILARVLSAFVTALDARLLTWLVRRRGAAPWLSRA